MGRRHVHDEAAFLSRCFCHGCSALYFFCRRITVLTVCSGFFHATLGVGIARMAARALIFRQLVFSPKLRPNNVTPSTFVCHGLSGSLICLGIDRKLQVAHPLSVASGSTLLLCLPCVRFMTYFRWVCRYSEYMLSCALRWNHEPEGSGSTATRTRPADSLLFCPNPVVLLRPCCDTPRVDSFV